MNGIPEVQTSEDAQSVNPIIGIEKRCKECQKIKPLDSFSPSKGGKNGRRAICKLCLTKNRGIDRAANLERYREKEAGWRAANPDMCARKRARQRFLYAANRKKAIERTRKWQNANKKKNKETRRLWLINNPNIIRAQSRRNSKKRRATIKGNLDHRMSNYILQSLQGKKERKSWKTLVDFSLDQLKKHLEKHFLPGMTWENRNLWHVDHIIPVNVFNYSSPDHIDFKRCWALKNLRPMWAKENISKSNKLQKPFQPSLKIGGIP